MIDSSYIEVYKNRDVSFKFRGRSYEFALSHGLFSSAGIDAGSALLLKVFSNYVDDMGYEASQPQITILDAGCGTGVLGICAAGALTDILQERPPAGKPSVYVRAQDRDDLARLFTEHNAKRNNINPEIFSAHAEPIFAGPDKSGQKKWDIILSNIPAKAGEPVLEDFVRRSAALLKPAGRVFLVAVNPLADFFRSRIGENAFLVSEQSNAGYTVFAYTSVYEGAPGITQAKTAQTDDEQSPIIFDDNFLQRYPFYIRNRSEFEMTGISYKMDTVHGAADFDSPNGAIQTAAILTKKIMAKTGLSFNDRPNILIHDDAGQGHFAVWLKKFLGSAAGGKAGGIGGYTVGDINWTLSGRNVLGRAAARAALQSGSSAAARWAVQNGSCDSLITRYSLIAFFPENVPQSKPESLWWDYLSRLCMEGAYVIAASGSMEMERFDKKKPPGFSRLGDLKRKGFRAAVYLRTNAAGSANV